MKRPLLQAAALALLVLAVAACESVATRAPKSDDPVPPAAPTSRPGQATATDCSAMVTVAEINAAMGLSLTDAMGGGSALTGSDAAAAAAGGFALERYHACTFRDAALNQVSIYAFQMATDGDADAFYTQLSGAGQAGQSISGVGDEATTLGPSLVVRSGSNVVQLMAVIQGDPLGDRSAALAELARVVIGRL